METSSSSDIAQQVTAPPPSCNAPKASEKRVFQHSPLNHEVSSIRLVRILEPTTPGERVRCQIRHGSVEDEYTCLSYVWGEEDAEDLIEIDGSPFPVRNNLMAFLLTARSKPHIRSAWLYIDALCINQANVTERNHQVQQMGKIYSNATKVISWLGPSRDIQNFFHTILAGSSAAYSAAHKGAFFFYNCNYWTRAWITQEFALARHNVLMAGDVDMDRERLELLTGYWRFTRVRSRSPTVQAHLDLLAHMHGRSIFLLLHKFWDKKCSHLRDRIFSLSALCYEQSTLQVDYGSTRWDLAKKILRTCRDSFCLCSVRFLDHTLHIENDAGERERSIHRPFAQVELSIKPKDWPLSGGPSAYIVRDVRFTSITIFLGHLCGSSFTNVSIRFGSDSCVSHADEDVELETMWCKSQTKGCDFTILEDGETCKLSFSLDALLVLARVSYMDSELHDCCSWIENLGLGNAQKPDTRILKLC
ncbi:heterokaryon incompatibility protein-domain-containing protein [Paraphoma chrysanthemicola]|uniref:Heterokaryon incompatibility protein-domain-containing protein n=1 Tax=Paraphoma chrysanthemicola TaxID=798071 RepID=A0A8K0RFV2_9PLEO|nr:heterokaryon incompatibility protein-domain-containing protein [Paraphoma chrysanthemicola]